MSDQIEFIEVGMLLNHPQNPRIDPRTDIVDQLAERIKDGFDPSHALIVRPVMDEGMSAYQIISGHHRWLAAQKAGLDEVPCWIREMSDAEAYMQLVLCNTQSELHPLEEGKHAAESGMDLKAYAEAAGKAQTTLRNKLMAYRVATESHVGFTHVRDSWRNLAEIHVAPQWLWPAMVQKMVEGEWTVATTRQQVANVKETKAPAEWCHDEQIGINLLSGKLSVSDIDRMERYASNAKVTDDELVSSMWAELKDAKPALLSDVQTIVNQWVEKQEAVTAERRKAELENQKATEAAKAKVERMCKNILLDEWNTLSELERTELMKSAEALGGSTFNKQDNDAIEWAQFSWNPITGCKHDCPYCYARDIALSSRMAKVYPNGFEPTFRPASVFSPSNVKIPKEAEIDSRYRNVFTCSMSDMFGRWVPAEWINAILDQMRKNPQWNFLCLTKFPKRMAEFDIPNNAWMGTTVDLQARVKAAEDGFANVNAGVKWLSVEPMLEPLKFKNLNRFDWVVIGGASKSSKTPEWHPPFEWIIDLVEQARAANCKVYFKTNLLGRRLLELPFDAPIPSDNVQAPKQFKYLGK